MKLSYHIINKADDGSNLFGFKPGVVFMFIEEGKLAFRILPGVQFDQINGFFECRPAIYEIK